MTEGGPALSLTGSCRTPWKSITRNIRSRNALPGLHTKASEGIYQGNGIGHVSITLNCCLHQPG